MRRNILLIEKNEMKGCKSFRTWKPIEILSWRPSSLTVEGHSFVRMWLRLWVLVIRRNKLQPKDRIWLATCFYSNIFIRMKKKKDCKFLGTWETSLTLLSQNSTVWLWWFISESPTSCFEHLGSQLRALLWLSLEELGLGCHQRPL